MTKACIQAVESRLPYVHQSIIPALTKHGIDKVEIFCDYGRIGPLWNSKRIWESIVKEDAPILVCQDDVVFHNSFKDSIAEILQHFASGDMQAASLFVPPRKLYAEHFARGFNFIENYDFLWMPAMILTPAFCRGLLRHAETSSHKKHDDCVVGDYSKESGVPVFNCLPSLVQHNLNIKSTLGTPKAIGCIERRTYVWEKSIAPFHFSRINSIPHKKPRGFPK